MGEVGYRAALDRTAQRHVRYDRVVRGRVRALRPGGGREAGLLATRGPSTSSGRRRGPGGRRGWDDGGGWDEGARAQRERLRTFRKRSLEKGGKEESLVKWVPARGAGLPPVAAAGVIAGVDSPAHGCQIEQHQHHHRGKNQYNTTIHRTLRFYRTQPAPCMIRCTSCPTRSAAPTPSRLSRSSSRSVAA